ncbi:hypothetical protein GGR16_002638 [Chelatococcus caeni]|uniref:DNA primase/polymerase bifunctional N-terminal domain-containing protein n=1 Tax=Chelatococcus caeni TaxID=1348468 RepID=A0A840BX27_9HYPH|nr:bifunctional DNA primase/polymerase [Chelatococcus caeni]MBB4017604.1 hypothetical protein [Chelatococcus caeni]
MDDKLSAALDIAGRGFRVFPLRERDKLPAISRFPTRATQDATQIREWWVDPAGLVQPNNIGIATGNGLLVLDIDQKPGKRGADSLDMLLMAYGELPATVEALTPSGGRHLYFRTPRDVANSQGDRGGIAAGIDVRCHHGYVVAPGSVTAAGSYEWAIGRSPKDLPIADAPDWLLSLCEAPRERKETDDTPLVDLDTDDAIRRAERWLAESAPIAIEGEGGDVTTYRVAARLKDFGISPPLAFEMLANQWNDRCRPPWQPDELMRKVDNAYAYGTSPPGVRTPQADFGPADYEPPPPAPKPYFTAEAFTGEPPERRWIVEDWIPAGTVTSIYGDGGLGKTLLAQQLIYASSTGRQWLGMDAAPRKCLAVFCEDDRDELHRRHAAIVGGLGYEFADGLANALIWPRVGEDNLLVTFDAAGKPTRTPFLRQLAKAVLDERVELLVLDTVADMFGGNESLRAQVNYFVKTVCGGLIKAAAQRGVELTVIILAHPSLAGMATGTGSSGSTAWNNAVRSRLYLTRPEDGRGDERILSRKKANYAAAGDDTAIRLRWDGGVLRPRDEGDNDWPAPHELAAVASVFGEAWEAGAPLSPHPQTRATGRFAPRVLHQRLGMDATEAARLVDDWLGKGILKYEECDKRSKLKGLRVVKSVDEIFAIVGVAEVAEVAPETSAELPQTEGNTS